MYLPLERQDRFTERKYFLITQAILTYRARFHRFSSSFMPTEFHLPVTEHRLKHLLHTSQTCIQNVVDLDIMLL